LYLFFRSKQLIKDAIMDNDFLKNLDSSQVRELVDSMYPLEYAKGSYVIREGETGMLLDILRALLFLIFPHSCPKPSSEHISPKCKTELISINCMLHEAKFRLYQTSQRCAM
jgi:hypothetical protein